MKNNAQKFVLFLESPENTDSILQTNKKHTNLNPLKKPLRKFTTSISEEKKISRRKIKEV